MAPLVSTNLQLHVYIYYNTKVNKALALHCLPSEAKQIYVAADVCNERLKPRSQWEFNPANTNHRPSPSTIGIVHNGLEWLLSLQTQTF